MSNPIDLTTLAAVARWINYQTGVNTSQDQNISDCITAFSAYALRQTGRGPIDGTDPTTSPFVTPVAYDEFYDGSGTWRQPIRNWPIVSVAAVLVNGTAITQSAAVLSPGWVIDGDRRFISIRGSFGGSVATFRNFPYAYGRNPFAGQAPGGFCKGIQNVEIQYTAGYAAIPFDLEMLARKIVALNYKRTGWIGQKSQSMAGGAGTVNYSDWDMDEQDRKVLQYYRAQVVG